MTNKEIASLLVEIADLLEFQGANPFRIRAYRSGARAIESLVESVESIAADHSCVLTDIQGVGKDLAQKVAELLETGNIPLRDELLSEIPETVLSMLRVPGLGPKKAAAIYRELGVTTLNQLQAVCESGEVRALKGFGAKTEETILKGIDIASRAGQRTYWARADQTVQAILDHLRSCSAIDRLEAVGSYRRGRETVGDLDFLAISTDPNQVMDRLAELPNLAETLLRGDTKMSIRLEGGMQIDLRVVPEESFGAAMQYFTGSQAHNVRLRSMAKRRGLKINEYGVYREDERIAGTTEEEVYAVMDLPCFPPELREDRREFDWAAADTLPKLVELEDIRGDLHMHSTWSDGMATIEEMALAAKERGRDYIAITDHSKRVSMAGGLTGGELLEQWASIEEINRRIDGIRILKGVEVDILEPGGLDIEDEVLAQGDFVVASVHYGQNQPKEQITRRIVEALENPHVSAIGHPTGRLIDRREPYEIDLDVVLKVARDHGKMMELNAHPSRLDLNDLACAAAKSLGVPIVISTDAHNIDGLDCMRYGVLQARRAGLAAEDVANTRTWDELAALLGR